MSGRVWVSSMDPSGPTGISEGDVVVVGNRADAQRLAIDRGAALLVLSNGARPDSEVLSLARSRGTTLIVSPLDTYVSGRMITLAAPCRALMEVDPLTVPADDLLSDIAEQIRGTHYGAAVVIDNKRRPVGLVTRSDLVAPARRRVLLVDHAEEAQSVIGVDQAEIVEILDHHHIGSIETRIPVRATFDPVGSTATLVVERFRQNGMEPSRSTAMLLLCAIMADTVILNSPTTTERDHAVVEYLQRVLAVDARETRAGDVRDHRRRLRASAREQIITRDAKVYQTGSRRADLLAQVEVVGQWPAGALPTSCSPRCSPSRSTSSLLSYALMVTDVLSHGTDLLVAGDSTTVARAFDAERR